MDDDHDRQGEQCDLRLSYYALLDSGSVTIKVDPFPT
jgi:hypothetical protein